MNDACLMQAQSKEIMRLTDQLRNCKTPCYYYDLNLFDQTLTRLIEQSEQSNYQIHYALKANPNRPILERIKAHGIGADCVSGNEVKRALEVEFSADNIVFAGVGKTDDEIKLALSHDIFCFNCESIQEIQVINEIAMSMDRATRIAIRINPNVDANTHEYITTGTKDNKFGISEDQMEQALEVVASCQNIDLIGIHFHIGSQITNLEVFENLCSKVNSIQSWFESKGIALKNINVGGGLGIDYDNPDNNPIADFEGYFSVFRQYLNLRQGQRLHFELGRSIVGNCGSLLSRVLYTKRSGLTNFVVVDAGMTDLIRPALYRSFHKLENLSKDAEDSDFVYDVVGPICESSDCLGKAVLLPKTERGDLIAIRSTGAYGEVMASGYNLRQLPNAMYSK